VILAKRSFFVPLVQEIISENFVQENVKELKPKVGVQEEIFVWVQPPGIKEGLC